MKLKVNQTVIMNDNDNLVKCYVKRINKKTVTLHQYNPKLINGRVFTYRIPLSQVRKYLREG
jgi:hypothetical protein